MYLQELLSTPMYADKFSTQPSSQDRTKHPPFFSQLFLAKSENLAAVPHLIIFSYFVVKISSQVLTYLKSCLVTLGDYYVDKMVKFI